MTDEAVPPRRGRLARLARDQRVRFLAVGGFNTLAGYGVYSLFFWLWGETLGDQVGPVASLLAAHVLVSGFAFVIYRRFVFRVSGSLVKDYVRFQSVYVVSLGINVLLLWLLAGVLEWNAYLAQGAVVLVITIASFVGHRYFSFRRPHTGGTSGGEQTIE